MSSETSKRAAYHMIHHTEPCRVLVAHCPRETSASYVITPAPLISSLPICPLNKILHTSKRQCFQFLDKRTPRSAVNAFSTAIMQRRRASADPTTQSNADADDEKPPFQQVLHRMATEPPTSDGRILQTYYPELMQSYEKDIALVYEASDEACCRILADFRIPNLRDLDITVTGPSPRTPSLVMARNVKSAFYEAMENLHITEVPKKHRGNLPKEAVDKFKIWFNHNFDHPYPSDEAKMQLSNETGVGIHQITNWFINYRKRVWKHQLPATHPANAHLSQIQPFPLGEHNNNSHTSNKDESVRKRKKTSS